MIMIKKIFAVTGILILLASCAKPPAEEMNRAIEALTRAENDADAAVYAQNTLNRAREALQKMQEEAASKRYDSAKIFAADALAYAERAVSEGRMNAARVRDEASTLIDSLRIPLAETVSALNNAKLNDMQLDFNELGKSLDAVREDLENARQNLEANNFLEAIDQGQNIRSVLGSINTMINEAARSLSNKL